MKLHWSPRSPYARKVMVAAHETGLAGRIEPVLSVATMAAANAEVMRDNPLGKVPTLIDDHGRALFDSIVICEYLDSLHDGPKLFPAAGEARWQALRRQALGDGMLDTLILWHNLRGQPADRQHPDWQSNFGAKIRNSLDAIEREAAVLEDAPFGIGHIALACVLGYLDFRFTDLRWRDGHARGAAWFAEVSQRTSMKLTMPVDA